MGVAPPLKFQKKNRKGKREIQLIYRVNTMYINMIDFF